MKSSGYRSRSSSASSVSSAALTVSDTSRNSRSKGWCARRTPGSASSGAGPSTATSFVERRSTTVVSPISSTSLLTSLAESSWRFSERSSLPGTVVLPSLVGSPPRSRTFTAPSSSIHVTSLLSHLEREARQRHQRIAGEQCAPSAAQGVGRALAARSPGNDRGARADGTSGAGRGDLVHEVGQPGQDVRVGLGQDAMTQVEDVAAERARAGEDRAGAGLDHLPAGEQHRGVEVALQRLDVPTE